MSRSRAAATAAALSVALLASSCGGSRREAVPAAGTPVAVTVVRPVTSGADGELLLAGRVKAAEEVTIGARVAARLTSLVVRDGDRFHRGQALARFDEAETRGALEAATATLSSARLARDLAVRQEARMESLFAARVATQRELELAQSERSAAAASYAAASAEAERWSEGASLTAPFDGVVARRYADPGALLQPGQPVLDVRSAEVGEVEVAVPEQAIARVRAGRVTIQLEGGPWRTATLSRLEGMTDFTTRTRIARLRPADRSGLEAGAFVRVRLSGEPGATTGAGRDGRADAGEPAALSVPEASLVRRGGLTGVYVIRDGRAWLRWLRVGRAAGGQVEVLAGLSPDDALALSPQGLEDGRAVKVNP